MSAPLHLMSEAQIERFWSNVDRSNADGCWPWLRSLDQDGYGRVGLRLSGRRVDARAHRVAVAISGRGIPAGMCVLHSCGNRACANPAHLRVGTQAENMHDRQRSGGYPRIDTNRLSTEDAIRIHELRSQGLTYQQVATASGVCLSYAKKVVAGTYHRAAKRAFESARRSPA